MKSAKEQESEQEQAVAGRGAGVGGRLPSASGLYDPRQEHDACGVGLVADLSGKGSRRVVEGGLDVLRRLTHRGAAGSDPETGDGAGVLVAIPDGFFRRRHPELPPKGRYGLGMVFGGEGEESAMEAAFAEEGLKVLFWREVPCDAGAIGAKARATMPRIRQVFVEGPADWDEPTLERKLFVARRVLEKRVGAGTYVCSLSARTVVYKGLMLATQMEGFYQDLAAEDFVSPLALVHQRYSTNTFPTWSLAHPFRMLAHNGEINTLRGNRAALAAREPHLRSAILGDDLRKVLPLLDEGMSDSASLDAMAELLRAGGRSLCHAMLMLVPQAWGAKYHVGADVRAFFEYHSALMEPWDGPAAVAFTDGRNAGAILDRNGLRPARYTLTRDGFFVLASETGVLDIPPAEVARKGRLAPGEILFLDLERHRLMGDREVKTAVARRKPYRRWLAQNKIEVNGLFTEMSAEAVPEDLSERQRRFGYSAEDLETVLRPMAESGREPVGSMGNDAALAVLSPRPQLLFSYFRQLFAQVTNPPIDPIREELVMSIMTYIGNEGNILSETPGHAKLVKMTRPVLTDDELRRLKNIPDFPAKTLGLFFAGTLKQGLDALAAKALAAVNSGAKIIVLSDRSAEGKRIPSLLAVAAVNKALTEAGVRPSVGIVVESGEVREVHHFAVLLGFGATAVNPYLALATVSDIGRDDAVKAAANYVSAVCKGLMKIMSKMGISTLRSYRSARIFEAVGLGPNVMREYFAGVTSPVGGLELEDLGCNEIFVQRQ